MRGEGLSASDVALLQGRNNDNNGGFGDGNGWWIVLILLFAFNGWNGNRGNNGGSDSTSSVLPYLLAKDSSNSVQPNYTLTSDFAQIDRKLDNIANGICDSTFALNNTIVNGNNALQNSLNQGFSGLNTALVTQGYESRLGVQGLSSQLSNCCCEIREGISGVNYNMAMNSNAIQNAMCLNTRDIIDSQTNGTRAILDAITANRIEDKNAQIQAQQNEINALRLSASQEKQNNYLTSYMDKLNPNRCPEPAYIVPNPNCCYQYQVTQNGCGCNNGCY